MRGAQSSSGRLTKGVLPDALRTETIKFVQEQISSWRDDTRRKRVTAEPALNAQLCKYLNSQASNKLPVVQFHHEEQQSGRRYVDISAARYPDIYDPFLVLEGKRLPAPERRREREYLFDNSDKLGGGVQRFKLGLHGASLEMAAMVGYVQNGTLPSWLKKINKWIGEAAKQGSSSGHCTWERSDFLKETDSNPGARTVRHESSHSRSGEVKGKQIRLVHIWVDMKKC
jgi:hypothetical protein